MISIRLIIHLIAVMWLGNFVASSSLIVNTENGMIQGKLMKTNNDYDVHGFLGIPYARPPTGELRFEPPQKPISWSGIKDTMSDKSMCVQVDILTGNTEASGDEDCLYLNVFARNNSRKSPVMVFFHGGGFVAGSSNSAFYGPKYFLDRDVILVTGNYRLGALGFLSTQDLIVPGNMGLKDQTKILQWVKNNIHQFGGDPNCVTIFGQSAGGSSVNYHMISPLSKGFFQRGISQSGTALNPWAYMKQTKSKNNTITLAEYFGCSVKNSIDIINCLKKQEASDIIEADKIFRAWGYDPPVPFRPVIEPEHPGAFLTDEPDKLLREQSDHFVPWLVGGVTQEGCLKTSALIGRTDMSYRELNDDWQRVAQYTLFYDDIFSNNPNSHVTDKIRQFYFGNKAIDKTTITNATNMYSDVWFNIGRDNAIRNRRKAGAKNIYNYYFAYKGSSSLSTIFSTGDQADYGVCHCDELLYLFPIRDIFGANLKNDHPDNHMIHTLTTLWVNFARFGFPLTTSLRYPTDAGIIPPWKPVMTDELEYLYIQGPRNFTMSKNLNEKRFDFWRRIINNNHNAKL